MQGSGCAPQFDPGYGPLAQFEPGFASCVANDPSQEFAQIGIVSNHHDRFLSDIFVEQFTEIGECCLWPEGWVDLQFPFVSHLVSDEGRRLGRAFERTRDHCINLDIEGGQRPPDITALLDSLFVEPALLVLLGVGEMSARICVT